MTDAARGVLKAPGDYLLMLPGTWSFVPMTEPESVKKRIAKIVKDRMPKSDRVAKLRVEMRKDAEQAALMALEAGASLFAMAFELMEGVPFAASVMAIEPGWPDDGPREGELVGDRLLRSVPDATAIEHPLAAVVRRTEPRITRGERNTLTGIDLEYWMAREDREPTYFRITVPVSPDDGLVIDFFDAVMATVLWKDMGSALHSQTP
ncbi:hypothetical protein [Gryllotalpicola ginsengisoli]|uniref:hypothetical protein n=1 Tax=Gryllotalpicola ginsengisoli TaxID=444608 RepID=UPI0003B57ED3|nr:hypothetical protein [Gryllotalpicola ginsengisoli]